MGIYSNFESTIYETPIGGQARLIKNPDGTFSLQDLSSSLVSLHIKDAVSSSEAVTLGQVLGLVTTGTAVTLGTASTKDIDFFASSSQGLKADTALQPYDNISLLLNDSGYLTRTIADNLYSTSVLVSHRIAITGDGSWAVNFNGAADVSSVFTLSNTGVTSGSYNTSGNSITPMIIDAKGRITQVLDEIPLSITWDNISSKPSTLVGFGITDAQKVVTGAATTILYDNLTPDRLLLSDVSGKISTSVITLSDLQYVSSLTAPVQEQLDSKEPKLPIGLVSQYYRGDKTWQTLNNSSVGLHNVENTALSTWSGSSNLSIAGDLMVNTISVPRCKTITMHLETSDLFQQLVGIYSSSLYKTAKILIQAKSNSEYHATELLTIHDGTSVNMTEYGITNTGFVLAVFDMEVLDGNVRLLTTPLVSPLEITAICTLISST